MRKKAEPTQPAFVENSSIENLKPKKEAVYSGVSSGPYKKFYDEWRGTLEGQRIAKEFHLAQEDHDE